MQSEDQFTYEPGLIESRSHNVQFLMPQYQHQQIKISARGESSLDLSSHYDTKRKKSQHQSPNFTSHQDKMGGNFDPSSRQNIKIPRAHDHRNRRQLEHASLNASEQKHPTPLRRRTPSQLELLDNNSQQKIVKGKKMSTNKLEVSNCAPPLAKKSTKNKVSKYKSNERLPAGPSSSSRFELHTNGQSKGTLQKKKSKKQITALDLQSLRATQMKLMQDALEKLKVEKKSRSIALRSALQKSSHIELKTSRRTDDGQSAVQGPPQLSNALSSRRRSHQSGFTSHRSNGNISQDDHRSVSASRNSSRLRINPRLCEVIKNESMLSQPTSTFHKNNSSLRRSLSRRDQRSSSQLKSHRRSQRESESSQPALSRSALGGNLYFQSNASKAHTNSIEGTQESIAMRSQQPIQPYYSKPEIYHAQDFQIPSQEHYFQPQSFSTLEKAHHNGNTSSLQEVNWQQVMDDSHSPNFVHFDPQQRFQDASRLSGFQNQLAMGYHYNQMQTAMAVPNQSNHGQTERAHYHSFIEPTVLKAGTGQKINNHHQTSHVVSQPLNGSKSNAKDLKDSFREDMDADVNNLDDQLTNTNTNATQKQRTHFQFRSVDTDIQANHFGCRESSAGRQNQHTLTMTTQKRNSTLPLSDNLTTDKQHLLEQQQMQSQQQQFTSQGSNAQQPQQQQFVEFFEKEYRTCQQQLLQTKGQLYEQKFKSDLLKKRVTEQESQIQQLEAQLESMRVKFADQHESVQNGVSTQDLEQLKAELRAISGKSAVELNQAEQVIDRLEAEKEANLLKQRNFMQEIIVKIGVIENRIDQNFLAQLQQLIGAKVVQSQIEVIAKELNRQKIDLGIQFNEVYKGIQKYCECLNEEEGEQNSQGQSRHETFNPDMQMKIHQKNYRQGLMHGYAQKQSNMNDYVVQEQVLNDFMQDCEKENLNQHSNMHIAGQYAQQSTFIQTHSNFADQQHYYGDSGLGNQVVTITSMPMEQTMQSEKRSHNFNQSRESYYEMMQMNQEEFMRIKEQSNQRGAISQLNSSELIARCSRTPPLNNRIVGKQEIKPDDSISQSVEIRHGGVDPDHQFMAEKIFQLQNDLKLIKDQSSQLIEVNKHLQAENQELRQQSIQQPSHYSRRKQVHGDRGTRDVDVNQFYDRDGSRSSDQTEGDEEEFEEYAHQQRSNLVQSNKSKNLNLSNLPLPPRDPSKTSQRYGTHRAQTRQHNTLMTGQGSSSRQLNQVSADKRSVSEDEHDQLKKERDSLVKMVETLQTSQKSQEVLIQYLQGTQNSILQKMQHQLIKNKLANSLLEHNGNNQKTGTVDNMQVNVGEMGKAKGETCQKEELLLQGGEETDTFEFRAFINQKREELKGTKFYDQLIQKSEQFTKERKQQMSNPEFFQDTDQELNGQESNSLLPSPVLSNPRKNTVCSKSSLSMQNVEKGQSNAKPNDVSLVSLSYVNSSSKNNVIIPQMDPSHQVHIYEGRTQLKLAGQNGHSRLNESQEADLSHDGEHEVHDYLQTGAFKKNSDQKFDSSELEKGILMNPRFKLFALDESGGGIGNGIKGQEFRDGSFLPRELKDQEMLLSQMTDSEVSAVQREDLSAELSRQLIIKGDGEPLNQTNQLLDLVKEMKTRDSIFNSVQNGRQKGGKSGYENNEVSYKQKTSSGAAKRRQQYVMEIDEYTAPVSQLSSPEMDLLTQSESLANTKNDTLKTGDQKEIEQMIMLARQHQNQPQNLPIFKYNSYLNQNLSKSDQAESHQGFSKQNKQSNNQASAKEIASQSKPLELNNMKPLKTPQFNMTNQGLQSFIMMPASQSQEKLHEDFANHFSKQSSLSKQNSTENFQEMQVLRNELPTNSTQVIAEEDEGRSISTGSQQTCNVKNQSSINLEQLNQSNNLSSKLTNNFANKLNIDRREENASLRVSQNQTLQMEYLLQRENTLQAGSTTNRTADGSLQHMPTQQQPLIKGQSLLLQQTQHPPKPTPSRSPMPYSPFKTQQHQASNSLSKHLTSNGVIQHHHQFLANDRSGSILIEREKTVSSMNSSHNQGMQYLFSRSRSTSPIVNKDQHLKSIDLHNRSTSQNGRFNGSVTGGGVTDSMMQSQLNMSKMDQLAASSQRIQNRTKKMQDEIDSIDKQILLLQKDICRKDTSPTPTSFV